MLRWALSKDRCKNYSEKFAYDDERGVSLRNSKARIALHEYDRVIFYAAKLDYIFPINVVDVIKLTICLEHLVPAKLQKIQFSALF